MKQVRRLISVVLCMMMIISTLSMPVAAGEGMTDVVGHWAQETVTKWLETGLINGYGDGVFKPDISITRAEFYTLVDNVLGLQDSSSISFSDVYAEDWYRETIAKAVAAGYANGYTDNTFKPERSISRQEVAVVVANIMNYETSYDSDGAYDQVYQFIDGVDVAEWALPAVDKLIEKEVLIGNNRNLNIMSNITRAEAVTLLDRAFGTIYSSKGVFGGTEDEIEHIYGNVTITADDISLEHAIIYGDLLVTEGVADGEVNMNNVVIKGDTIIKGGGENSIYFNNVTVEGAVVVKKLNNKIRIVASGRTEIKATVLASGAILVEKELRGGGFETVTIPKEVAEGSEIEFDGSFDEVNIQAKGIVAKISDKAKIKAINIEEGADNTSIEGKGEVSKVSVKADDAVIDTPDTEIDVDDNVEGTKLDGKDVEGGTKTSTPSKRSSRSSSSSSSSNDDEDTDSDEEESIDDVTDDTPDTTTGSAISFTVKFDSGDDATEVEDQEIENGKLAIEVYPSRVGYYFRGWFIGDEEFDFDTPVTSDLTLVAKWGKRDDATDLDFYDERFAPGYPSMSVTDEGLIDLKIKLDEASEVNPALVHYVGVRENAYWEANTEAVLHGHTGTSNTIWANVYGEKKITTTEEYVIHTDLEVESAELIASYFVIDQENVISESPTALWITGSIAGELDMSRPYARRTVFADKGHEQFVIFTNEPLKKLSAYRHSDFTITGLEETTSGAAVVVDIEFGDVHGYEMMELTIDGISPSDDISDMMISYSGEGISDLASDENLLEDFTTSNVVEVAPKLSEYYISQDNKYLAFKVNQGSNEYVSGTVEVLAGANFNTAQKIDLEDIMYSYSDDEIEVYIILEDDVLNEENYYIQGEFIDMFGDIHKLDSSNITPTVEEDIEFTTASYDASQGILRIDFNGNINDGQWACMFTVKVNGIEYVPKGQIHAWDEQYFELDEENLYFDILDDAIIEVKYEPKHLDGSDLGIYNRVYKFAIPSDEWISVQ